MKYVVRIDDYEGPLDRMLRLVQKQEINIASVPVHEVIQQLVDFLEAVSYSDIDEGGRCLVLAATLLVIKAHLLLPEQETAADADGDHWNEDEAEDGQAVTAASEYLAIKEAARNLEDCARNWILSYRRPQFEKLDDATEERLLLGPDLRDDVARLVTAFREILVRTVDESVPYQITTAVDFEDKLRTVFGRIAGHKGRLPFRRLFENADRIEMIYSFLAVLELVFRGRLRLSRRQATGEIVLVVNERQADARIAGAEG